METLGKVYNAKRDFYFEWKIEKFFSLPKGDKRYYTPSFSFAGASWYLEMCPYDSEGEYVGVNIYLEKANTPITLTWSFSLKTINGKNNHKNQSTQTFKKATSTSAWGWDKFVKRSTLLEKKLELVPSEDLTIVFTAEFCSKSIDEMDHSVKIPCNYCKKVLDVPSHDHLCLDMPMICPTCKKAIALRNWPEHECVTATIKGDEELVNDFAKILESEEHSDFTVKVKDTEFRLHKSILAARNPFFNSMFNAEMMEKKTGIVSLNDCEPDTFRSFVHFVYTGKLKALTQDNVCALYKVADKYQQDRLKAECLKFMKNKISTESFCDFVVLALMHDEEELLRSATDLFCRQTKEIIQTVQWQNFMREYPTQANELHIKALDYNAK